MSDIQAVTYSDSAVVTKSDTTADPAGPFAGFYTGEGGDIKVTTIRGRAVVFKGTAAGIVIPQAITRVWSTGTSPADVLGMISYPIGTGP